MNHQKTTQGILTSCWLLVAIALLAPACNYDPGAAFEDGSCTFPPEACAWPDTWAAGCTYADAENYDENAVVDDGSCTWGPCSVCVGDLDGDNVVAVTDVLLLLSAFGTLCQ